MSDLFSIVRLVVTAGVRVVDGLMSLFAVFHDLDRHLSESSRLGQSPLSRENQDWRQWWLDTWHWISLGLIVLTAMITAAVHHAK